VEKWLEELTKQLQPDFVCELPFDPAGPDGADRLVAHYQERMAEVRRQEAVTPQGAAPVPHLKLSLTEPTVQALADLASLGGPSEGDRPAATAEALLEEIGGLVREVLSRHQQGKANGPDPVKLADEVGQKIADSLRGKAVSGRQAG
jgi:hypothetical protein